MKPIFDQVMEQAQEWKRKADKYRDLLEEALRVAEEADHHSGECREMIEGIREDAKAIEEAEVKG